MFETVGVACGHGYVILGAGRFLFASEAYLHLMASLEINFAH